MKIPIVKAWRMGSNEQYTFWCPFCDTFHYHFSEGHKTAHCSNPNSPFKESGYIIKSYTEQDLAEIRLHYVYRT